MLLTALTGGIGSGKSTVAAGLARRGAPLIDADAIARALLEPGAAGYGAVVDRFGPSVVGEGGAIDRPALAAVVFADPSARRDLNAITHPLIGAEIVTRAASLESHPGPVVLDVPLLDRTTLAVYRPAALIVVDTPEDTAVARLVAQRGFSEADARARVAAQMSREERRRLLDAVAEGMVIDNSGERAALEEQVERAWEWLRALAGRLSP